MKMIWKWIIGIALGLVVVAVLAGAAFMFRTGFRGCGIQGWGGSGWNERGRDMMPFGDWQVRVPGMVGFGGMMSPFRGLLSGLILLGVMVLIVLGIIWLVRTLYHPHPALTDHACLKCNQPLQPGWNNCPYCGTRL